MVVLMGVEILVTGEYKNGKLLISSNSEFNKKEATKFKVDENTKNLFELLEKNGINQLCNMTLIIVQNTNILVYLTTF
jgi:ribosomal protein L4